MSACVSGEQVSWLTGVGVDVASHGNAVVAVRTGGRRGSCRADHTRSARFAVVNCIRIGARSLFSEPIWAHIVLATVAVVAGRVNARAEVLNMASVVCVGSALRHEPLSILRALNKLDARVIVILVELGIVAIWHGSLSGSVVRQV